MSSASAKRRELTRHLDTKKKRNFVDDYTKFSGSIESEI